MACTRKLAQGIEHRQDFHLIFISHLDQDFKVRACACLSVSCLVSLLLDSLPAHKSHVSTRHFASLLTSYDVRRHYTLALSMDVYNSQFLDSLTSLSRFEILTEFSLHVSSTSCRISTPHSSPVPTHKTPTVIYPNSLTPEPNTSNPSNNPLLHIPLSSMHLCMQGKGTFKEITRVDLFVTKFFF
jgi:hypothetical protein